jgi:predicted protein tyrosine phosphatase
MNFINIPRMVTNNELYSKPYVLVSITDKPEIIEHEFRNCKGIVRMSFHDLEEPIPGYSYTLFDSNMAKQIVNFVKEHKDKDYIFIHCEAGISRSAGIAAALNKFYNGKDKRYFDKYCPNMLCYNLIMNELKENIS